MEDSVRTYNDAQYFSNDLMFQQAAPQGFGDRHNSWAWSMVWWKGKVYAGTNRAWHCAEHASLNSAFSLFVKYPPKDPDAQCASDPTDLPLQAEIWCWTPENDSWERLYQSPKDVPIPGKSGKYVAREVGYRYMAPFVEPDGTEALYVSGVNSRFIFRPVPAPRILRSVDGTTFEPLPADAGTFMGSLDKCSFRTLVTYKKRLFVHVGSVRGEGIILESSDPAQGNDSFRQISPPGMRAFEMLPYNGYLYVGLRDPKKGYSVVKTNATGSPPYQFTTVVEPGAYAANPSYSVISMFVFRGRLYVGTDRPGEIIRINPDDTWDLVCGAARQTPTGWKYPISSLDTGFGNWLNAHIWRMQEYNGRLYVGTWNMATDFRRVSGADTILSPHYGFDLFETTDGWHFTPITTNGFGDLYSNGIRSFAATPHGLFVGTANKWEGLRIWRGVKLEATQPASSAPAMAGSEIQGHDVQHRQGEEGIGESPGWYAPRLLEAETVGNAVLLSWEDNQTTGRYRIYRARLDDIHDQIVANPFMSRMIRVIRTFLFFMPDLYAPPIPDHLWVPGPYEELAVSEHPYWIDTDTLPGVRYLYRVQAEYGDGNLSTPSNIVSVPSPIQPVTFTSLIQRINRLAATGRLSQPEPMHSLTEHLRQAHSHVEAGDSQAALSKLQLLARAATEFPAESPDWPAVDDLQVLVAKLNRRVLLCQAGALASEAL